MKLDATVRRETIYIAVFTLALSVIMELVFLVTGYWDYTVILGNLLGAAVAILNFFLMGLTVQSAVLKDADTAKKKIKTSQSLRLLMVFVFAALGVWLSCFHPIAVLVPLFFPRIAIAFRPLFNKVMGTEPEKKPTAPAENTENANGTAPAEASAEGAPVEQSKTEETAVPPTEDKA